MSSFQLHLCLLSECLNLGSEREIRMAITNYRVFKEWAIVRYPQAQDAVSYDLYKKVRAFFEEKAPHLRFYSCCHHA